MQRDVGANSLQPDVGGGPFQSMVPSWTPGGGLGVSFFSQEYTKLTSINTIYFFFVLSKSGLHRIFFLTIMECQKFEVLKLLH